MRFVFNNSYVIFQKDSDTKESLGVGWEEEQIYTHKENKKCLESIVD